MTEYYSVSIPYCVPPETDPSKPVTLKMPVELLTAIDTRAGQLDLNRSQYFRRLVRRDLEQSATRPRHRRQRNEVPA